MSAVPFLRHFVAESEVQTGVEHKLINSLASQHAPLWEGRKPSNRHTERHHRSYRILLLPPSPQIHGASEHFWF